MVAVKSAATGVVVDVAVAVMAAITVGCSCGSVGHEVRRMMGVRRWLVLMVAIMVATRGEDM